MKRQIVHIDLDTFFVSVERLLNTSLLGKPLLIGGNSDRAVVASCSYEARQYGVYAAMPMRLAKRLCPEAIILRGDMEQYSKYSILVTEIIKERVPLYEKASIDEFYIDMTGMDKFLGAYKYAHELRSTIIHESGLPLSMGFSQNKTVSKIATGEAKPNGEKQVGIDMEKDFLSPLSIKKIPMLGDKTYQLLRSMGVEKIKTLQSMPVALMEYVLGENGKSIWLKANGIDNNPVVQYNEQKSISTETTLEQDTTDIQYLKSLLLAMCEKLGYELRQQGKLTQCITIKIRYSNFDTHTQQVTVPFTSLDQDLIRYVLELFNSAFQRRMLIRLIGVRLSKLVQGNYQIDLFNDTKEKIDLLKAIDKINTKYGTRTIRRANSEKYR